MENKKLSELRNSLTMLPVLQKRLQNLELYIAEARMNMQELQQQYNDEVLDVDKMKKDTLSHKLLKLIKQYDGRLDKEIQEMLTAKLEYEKASDRVTDLYNQREELNMRISSLLESKQAFENELMQREETVKKSITSKAYLIYTKLEEQREKLSQQLIEIDEAIRAAKNVEVTIYSAMQHLEGAESWATYDVWARGGILSHMAKYDHIDNAQADFNKLSYQLGDLMKELADIEVFEIIPSLGIDSTTRMFDFWFDNIFTDLNVRDKIRADMEEVNSLSKKIAEIITRLEESKSETFKEIEAVEDSKKDLLINNN